MQTPRATELIDQGLVSRPDAVVEIRETIGDPRSGVGGRAYHIALSGGLTFEVLPDRGLDIGSLWHRGYPVAWRSALAATGPEADPAGRGWIGRFGGGMLVTCGLDNIGPAQGGFGLHGSHHATRASDVVVRRTPAAGVLIAGTVDSAAVFGRQVYLHREIEASADRASLTVRDRIVNDGTTTEPVALLYHLNFGAPFLMPGTRVEIPAGRHLAREQVPGCPSWQVFPEPTTRVEEAVWEHTDLVTDQTDTANAVVCSAALAVTATISWNARALPRCVQWTYPSRRGWALGIEPANAPIFGPDRAGANAGAPLLEPGQSLESGFTLDLTPRAAPHPAAVAFGP